MNTGAASVAQQHGLALGGGMRGVVLSHDDNDHSSHGIVTQIDSSASHRENSLIIKWQFRPGGIPNEEMGFPHRLFSQTDRRMTNEVKGKLQQFFFCFRSSCCVDFEKERETESVVSVWSLFLEPETLRVRPSSVCSMFCCKSLWGEVILCQQNLVQTDTVPQSPLKMK